MNKELPIVLHNLAVGYSKKGVHLSQVHQQNDETQRLVQLRQLHPLYVRCVASDLNATACPGSLTCLDRKSVV